MIHQIKSICVFCGSSPGSEADFVELAKKTGEVIAKANLKLVYGGAKVGCMGAVADGALSQSGEVLGILPRVLKEKELAHEGITDLRIIDTLMERKVMMINHSDAFIALPGGFGTLDEFFEVLTWNQLNLIQKPIALLNHNGFFNGVIDFMKHAQSKAFVKSGNQDLYSAHSTLDSLFKAWRIEMPINRKKK